MRVLGLGKANASTESGEPPSQELIERMGKLVEEAISAGVIVDTNGLTPTSRGKRVMLTNGKVTVIDGPFTESKELVASYAILEVKSMDEAVEWARRFLEVGGSGECELRPIGGFEDGAAEG